VTYLDDIKTYTPKDWEAIEACAKLGVFFYDGPGVILPSGRRCTGEVMRALITEAGFNPLERSEKDTWQRLQVAGDKFEGTHDQGYDPQQDWLKD
jgi:hypothetical protein